MADPDIWQGGFNKDRVHAPGAKSVATPPFHNPTHFVVGANDLDGEASYMG